MAHQLCIACQYTGLTEICHGRCLYINLFRAEDMNATFWYFGVYPRLVDFNRENNARIRESTMIFEVRARVKDRVYGITGVILLLLQYLWRNVDYSSHIETGVWYGCLSPTPVLIQPDISAPQAQHQPCTACLFLARSCSSDCEFAPFFGPYSPVDLRYESQRLFTRRFPVEIPTLRQLSVAEKDQIMRITKLFEDTIREYDPIYGASRILFTLVKRLVDVNARLDSLVRSIAIKRHQIRVSMGIQHQRFNDLPFPRKYNEQQIWSPDREINQASTGRGIVRYNENIGSWQRQQQEQTGRCQQLVQQHGQHPQPPGYSSEIVVRQPQCPAPTAMNWGGLQQQQQQQHDFHRRALEGCELQRSQQRPRLQLPHQPEVPLPRPQHRPPRHPKVPLPRSRQRPQHPAVPLPRPQHRPQHPAVPLPRSQHRPQHPAVPLPRSQHPAVPLPRPQHPAVLPSQSQQHGHFGIGGSSSATVVGQSNFNSSSITSHQYLPAALTSLEYFAEDDYFVTQFMPELLRSVPLQRAFQPAALQRPPQPAMPSHSREDPYSGIVSSSSATVVGPSNPNSSSIASHQYLPAPLISLEYFPEDDYFVEQFGPELLRSVPLQRAFQPAALHQPPQPAMPSPSREDPYSGIVSSSSATAVGQPSNPNSSSTASDRSVPAPTGLYDSGSLEFPQANQ